MAPPDLDPLRLLPLPRVGLPLRARRYAERHSHEVGEAEDDLVPVGRDNVLLDALLCPWDGVADLSQRLVHPLVVILGQVAVVSRCRGDVYLNNSNG